MSAAVPANNLTAPLYGAGIAESLARFFRKYATFSGRASRSEFWWPVFVGLVGSAVTEVVSVIAAGGFVAAGESGPTQATS